MSLKRTFLIVSACRKIGEQALVIIDGRGEDYGSASLHNTEKARKILEIVKNVYDVGFEQDLSIYFSVADVGSARHIKNDKTGEVYLETKLPVGDAEALMRDIQKANIKGREDKKQGLEDKKLSL